MAELSARSVSPGQAGPAASNALLAATAAGTLSFALIAFPFDQFHTLDFHLHHRLELLFVPATVLLFASATLLRRRRQLAIAMEGRRTEAEAPWLARLRAAVPELDDARVGIAVSGSGEPVDPDPTIPAQAPSILLPGTQDAHLLIAPRTLARLERDPEALRAVVLHELAHHEVRDSQRVDDMRRLIKVVIAMSLIIIGASCYGSFRIDQPHGFSLRALWATICGKAVLIQSTLLTVVMLWLRRAFERVREEIADGLVIERMGSAEPLNRADQLLRARPHIRYRGGLTVSPLTWSLALGFSVGMLFINASGFFVTLSRETETASAIAIVVASHGFALVAFLALASIVVRDRAQMVHAFAAALTAAWGYLLAYVAGHVIPAAMISMMPPGYDYVFRHDVSALFIDAFSNGLSDYLAIGTTIAALLLALAWAPIARRRATRLGIIALIIASSVAETLLRLRPMVGDDISVGRIRSIIVGCGGAAAIAIASHAVARPRDRVVAIVSLLLVGGLQAGEVHDLSLDSTRLLARAYAQAGGKDLHRALKSAKDAAARSPYVASVWFEAGRLAEESGLKNEGAALLLRATSLPSLSTWQDRAVYYVTAADALLDRDIPGDRARAADLVQRVREMRRRNSRLPPDAVSSALFLSAILATKSNQPRERALALLWLFEANSLNPRVSEAITTDRALLQELAPLLNGPTCQLPSIPPHLSSFGEDVVDGLARTYAPEEIECFARFLVRTMLGQRLS